MTRTGWFADILDTPETAKRPRHPWQPVLQLEGMCLPLPIWFETELECLVFIRREIVGKGLLDHDGKDTR